MPSSRRPPSAVRIRLFVPHSLTVCSPLAGWKACPTAACRPPSIPRSAVCGPHSFIRSLFVDGMPPPTGWKACPTAVCPPPFIPRSAVCRPRSAFVYSFPDSLTICLPRQAGKPALRRPAVCRPRSAFVYSFPDSLTICLPRQAGKPALRRPAVLRPPRGLPSAVCIRLFVPHSLTVFPPPGWKARATALPSTVHRPSRGLSHRKPSKSVIIETHKILVPFGSKKR
jgi:hypothetical protein